MKRVILARPTYGPALPECSVSVIGAVMTAASHGVQWVGQAAPEREGWSSARNRSSDAVREMEDVDGMIWVDDDMWVPTDAFARLVAHDLDLVSALYFQREFPYWPNIFKLNKKGNGFDRLKVYPADKIAPIPNGGGFGFGCCYTSKRLLLALPKSPFGFGEFSEDLGFCHMAFKKAGVTPHIDTGIRCKHYAGVRWGDERRFRRFTQVEV